MIPTHQTLVMPAPQSAARKMRSSRDAASMNRVGGANGIIGGMAAALLGRARIEGTRVILNWTPTCLPACLVPAPSLPQPLVPSAVRASVTVVGRIPSG